MKNSNRRDSDFYPTPLPPGTRVLANGKPGTVVTIPIAISDGYCVVKLDHRSNADNTYLGTQFQLAEVQSMMLMVAPPAPPKPVLWKPVVIRPVRKLVKAA